MKRWSELVYGRLTDAERVKYLKKAFERTGDADGLTDDDYSEMLAKTPKTMEALIRLEIERETNAKQGRISVLLKRFNLKPSYLLSPKWKRPTDKEPAA